jgi:hypothetical protein
VAAFAGVSQLVVLNRQPEIWLFAFPLLPGAVGLAATAHAFLHVQPATAFRALTVTAVSLVATMVLSFVVPIALAFRRPIGDVSDPFLAVAAVVALAAAAVIALTQRRPGSP